MVFRNGILEVYDGMRKTRLTTIENISNIFSISYKTAYNLVNDDRIRSITFSSRIKLYYIDDIKQDILDFYKWKSTKWSRSKDI
jgi:hypothetical protein